jgi:predicted permease
VLSLAVGIGVNATLSSFLQALWLEPVPGVNADQVVEVLASDRGRELQEWAYPDFEDVRDAETPLEELVGWKPRDGSLTTADGSQRVEILYVSANYFRVLGVVLPRGRDFLPSENVAPGQHTVTVLSHALWQNQFGGDPEIVGRTITLNRSPYTVVGVAPESFKGHRTLGHTDLWIPIMQSPYLTAEHSLMGARDTKWLQVLGRLRSGTTTEQANAALSTVFARLAQEYPETNEDRGARVYAFGPVPALGRAESMAAVGLLVGLALLVLLIICGNVAGMMLARSATREREIAVRMALGSGRGRLARHLMVEAGVLAVVGGGLGVLLAYWVTGAATPATLGMLAEPSIKFQPSLTVLVWSLVLTLGTVLAVGLLPAIRFSRPDLVSSLKEGTGGGTRRVGRVHRIAASAQAGVAVALVVTCSLFLRAVGEMNQRDYGFDPTNLLVASLDLSLEGYESLENAGPFLDHVKESIAALPGVSSVSLADGLPLDQVGNFTGVSRPDQSVDEGGRVQVEFTRTTEGYFQTIGTPVLRGRGFEVTDDASSEPVVVITQALADRLWLGEEVVGRRVHFSLSRDEAREYTVVGVVGHVASSRATEDWPHVFVALRQQYRPRVMFVVKADAESPALVRSIQSTILAADPNLSFPPVVSSESLVARSTQSQRATATLAAGLGLLALLLSAIGVYGVVAFAVASRTREIGLRMALGATQEKVLRAVLEDGVRLAVPGLLLGALLAVGMAAGMQRMLLGVSPLDPISLGSAAAVLFVVVLLASAAPARRASKVDPMDVLRWE